MLRKKRSDEKGAAAVEFALVASLALIPLLMGIVDVSMVFNQRTQLQNAAMQGARHFAIHHDMEEAKQVVVNASPANLGIAPGNVVLKATRPAGGPGSATCDGGAGSQANEVIVTKDPYTTITGFLSPFFSKIDGRGVAECM